MPDHDVNRYHVRFYSSRPSPNPIEDSDVVAIIYLYEDPDPVDIQTRAVYSRGRIKFYADGTALPEPTMMSSSLGHAVYMSMHISQLHTVYTMLQTDRPLRTFYFTGSGYPEAGIGTEEYEPVGEEES